MNTIFASNAVIEKITTNQNARFVTISYTDCPPCRSENQQVTLIVDRNTIIRNETGATIPFRELEVGMVIDATFSSVMTRSIPPQAQAFRIRVVRRMPAHETTTGRILETNFRNQTVITINNSNPASVIQFNLSPDTVILNQFGRPIPFSVLIPGLRVRVQHASFMTASIPPQTTAFVIQIL